LPDVVERWQASISTGRPFDMVFPLRGADGAFRPFLTRVMPVCDQDGKVARWFGTNTDISEQKRTEEALQKAHVELAEQMEERVKELHEKEVLLKEVHHRVKNNLQVISSLVGMQADVSGDETVREVLRDVTYRVRSMAMVHEKLYHSESLSRIDFAEYAQSLLGYLWRAHGATAEAVRLTFDLEPVSLPVDTAVPCGLILNELAGNALKHAFRGRSEGEVTVSLHGAANGRISLNVRDNGVGLPARFDWRQASSLGLRLVQMLAGQLGATVEVSGEKGTAFEISFSRGAADGAEKTRLNA
jgi:two-component sensor histidine kinase